MCYYYFGLDVFSIIFQIIKKDQTQPAHDVIKAKKDRVATEKKLSCILETNNPSKKVSNSAKQQELNIGQKKSLDSWSNITEAFPNLYDQLNPNDPDSEVDKAVKYIFDINIPIRHLNVRYGTLSLRFFQKQILPKDRKNAHPLLKVGRFSPGANGEDGIICQNWERLAKEAGLEDPPQFIEDLKNLISNKSKSSLNVMMQNVIGCYLGQDLTYIRHGSDVFQRAVAILYPWNKGMFSKDEDEIILKEVEANGENYKTFWKVAEVLERPVQSIKDRYYVQINSKGLKSGMWNLADYEQFLEFVFQEERIGNKSGIDYINSIPLSVIDDAAKVLDWKPRLMYKKWMQHIKPLLLSYLGESLHADVKSQFYDYLIKNKIGFSQEIDWEDVEKEFPNHSSHSLQWYIYNIFQNKLYKDMPIYFAVEDYKEKTKHSKTQKRKKLKKLKEDIIFLYNKARGVLPTEN
jgi:hypothetical protein